MEQKLYEAASKLPKTNLAFHEIQPAPKKKMPTRVWRVLVSLTACVVLVFSIGFGTVEAKEYHDAVRFFSENGLSASGLSRSEIKAVHKDITTQAFTYSKTAEVIANSLSDEQIDGYEILQENPTPEEIENLWNYKNYSGGFVPNDREGLRYVYFSEYKMDKQLGFEVYAESIVEKYDGETLLWRVSITDFEIVDYSEVSDGILVYGTTPTWSSHQRSNAWMAKIRTDGTLVWQRMLENGFQRENIAAILENTDGSYAVISRGDLEYFCLSQYTAEAEEILVRKTRIGNYGIWNAIRLGEGYAVQLGSYITTEYAKIIKVDWAGNITDSFIYDNEEACHYVTDMTEYNGKIYLSGYSVPRHKDSEPDAGGRYEIDAVLDYLFDHRILKISSEELTPMVRENYTALLLICDPDAGIPETFYAVKGSLGGPLSHNDAGMLQWDVERITTTFFSPMTSSFTIGGTSHVFRYTFTPDGQLSGQEKTGEIVNYRR